MKHPKHQPRIFVLPVVLCLVLPGCGGPGDANSARTRPEPLPASVADRASPRERLEAVLLLGREPGRLPLSAWQEAERALEEYLPDLEAEGNEGLGWRVLYTDLPEGDYLAIDLLEGEGDEAVRHAWFHLLYLPDPPEDESFDGPALRGFPTAGTPGRYLRLRAGSMDLLAVPESPELKSDTALRELVGRFDLEGLADVGER